MKKSSTCLGIGAVLFILLVSPVPAKAGNLKIWMDQFTADWQPMNGTSTTRTVVQNPGELMNSATDPSATTLYYWAPVNLPVGTVIKSVVYYHGGSPAGGKYTSCFLFKNKFGKSGTLMALGSSMAETPATVTLTGLTEANSTIAAGSRYFVKIILNEGTMIRGVQLFY